MTMEFGSIEIVGQVELVGSPLGLGSGAGQDEMGVGEGKAEG